MNPNRLRVLAGILLWAGVAGAVTTGAFEPGSEARNAARRVADFAFASPREIEVSLPVGSGLRAGDPVFVADPDRFLVPVGRVESAADDVARVVVYPEYGARLRMETRAVVYTVPDTVAWIVATLAPPEKVREIGRMASEFFRREGDAIRDTLMPEIERGLAEVVALYQEDLPAAFARHETEIAAIVGRHRDGVIAEKLLPVLRRVGGEVAAEKFRPLAEEVGRELLAALPVWSIGWRYLWEKVPFTEDEQARRRFEQYLREQAAPILEARTEEAVRLSAAVGKELIGHPDVKEAVRAVADEIAADPEVRALSRTLFDELVLQNDRLADALRRRWSDGLHDAVGRAASRTEPLVTAIFQAVVLSPDRRSLSPRFAHVLRTRVFWKDRRFILLEGGDGAALPDRARLTGERPDE